MIFLVLIPIGPKETMATLQMVVELAAVEVVEVVAVGMVAAVVDLMVEEAALVTVNPSMELVVPL